MKVLILGSGGREHALSWKISESPLLTKLYVAPGNAGTAMHGENVPLSISDFDVVGRFALEKKIDMIIVGPEEPLVRGFHDYILKDPNLRHIMVVGPRRNAALLEGSKDYAKKFMKRHAIPTADFDSFTRDDMDSAISFLKKLNTPYVLKADGLAAGKGVLILDDLDEAIAELEHIFGGKFGAAGNKVVIETFLKGIELSVFVVTDGHTYKILPEAKDYKRIGEGDTGLNTGGMGCVSPVPFAVDSFMDKVESRIVRPTIQGLQDDGIDYQGFIFFGLMNVEGEPYVIEYNVRMGDPEAEVVIPRIKSDLLDLLLGVSKKDLDQKKLEIDSRTVSTIMLVSGGYPGIYEKGKIISGLTSVQDSILFHAGTRQENDGILTNGGRVLAVSSFGEDLNAALKCSYKNAGKIFFDQMYYRKDIGFDLI